MAEGIFTWAKTESPAGYIVLKSDKPGMSKRQQKKQQQQKPQNNTNNQGQNNKKKQNKEEQHPDNGEQDQSTGGGQGDEGDKEANKKEQQAAPSSTSNETTPAGDQKQLPIQYEYVIPFRYAQFESSKVIDFPSFNDAVDEFYSKIEAQKHERAVLEQEQSVFKKMEKVKKDQQHRINSLEAAHLTNLTKASLIETNIGIIYGCLCLRMFLISSPQMTLIELS